MKLTPPAGRKGGHQLSKSSIAWRLRCIDHFRRKSRATTLKNGRWLCKAQSNDVSSSSFESRLTSARHVNVKDEDNVFQRRLHATVVGRAWGVHGRRRLGWVEGVRGGMFKHFDVSGYNGLSDKVGKYQEFNYLETLTLKLFTIYNYRHVLQIC